MDTDDFMKELLNDSNSFFNDKPISSRPIPLLSDDERASVCGKRIIPIFDPVSAINRQIVYYCRQCESCQEYRKMALFRKLRRVLEENGGQLFATIADKDSYRGIVRSLDGQYTSVPIEDGDTPFMLGVKCVFSKQKLVLQSFSVNSDELLQLFSQNNLANSGNRISGELHKNGAIKQKDRREGGPALALTYREVRGEIDQNDMLKAQAIAVKQNSVDSDLLPEHVQSIINSRQQTIIKLLSSWGYDVYLSAEKKVEIDAQIAVENMLQSVNIVAENIPEHTPLNVVASIREQDKNFSVRRIKINS